MGQSEKRLIPTTTNMENLGVEPDIFVENSPEDNLAGRDRQLETAVPEADRVGNDDE